MILLWSAKGRGDFQETPGGDHIVQLSLCTKPRAVCAADDRRITQVILARTNTLRLAEAVMRFAGRITEWNDAKGFGFVVPNGGGTRAFVHISEFPKRCRRPVVGDLISYLPVVDGRNRTNAQQIQPAGAKAQPVRRPSRVPRAALGLGALAFASIACFTGVLPLVLLGIYVGASTVSYVMYGWDKSSAQKGVSRTPESSLHMADFLGGWPGALIAQQQFRHKTIKQPFQFVFWMTVALNVAACVWLIRSGLAAEFARSVMN
jgi:uncharacterized membrane protein YsdA (DUF1294 family)/cold shock CspA family protein